MEFANLTSKNAILYASRHYDNPQCISVDEFAEDYKRFKYVKRLCRRYLTTRHLSERLILNHLIGLLNVFGPEATVRLLFVKCDDERSYRVLKPFLEYLNILPPVVTGVDGYDIVTADIPTDERIWKKLGAL
jgi:hypothetical protein